MKPQFLLLAVLALASCGTTSQSSSSSEFVYCPPARFANCTIAQCEPKSGGYSCRCFLDDRYSATAAASTCVAATSTTAQSRFHPVQSYQLCTNPAQDSPLWAWCLGVGCTIDASGEVLCDCTSPPAGVRRLPYVVVTSTFLPQGCRNTPTGGVWSSATPDDVLQITEFLRQQAGLGHLQAPVVVTDRK